MAGLIDAAVRSRFSQPFVWGRCDCCMAVADVLVAMGRPDPAAPYRGRYHDEAGAAEALRGGVAGMMDREAARLGWREISPSAALPGDVGVCKGVLLIRTETAWAGKGLRGAVILRRAERAWRTG